MLAAIAATEQGCQVTLLEQNEKLGKKIYITGKGRCNLTNASDMDTVRAHVVRNPKFLYSAFSAFDNRDIVRLLEEEGCPVKVERGNRVFPASDHASDVIRALRQRLERMGVDIRLHTRVLSLLCGEGVCRGVRFRQETGNKTEGNRAEERSLSGDAVIVATGGCSYPSCGSTGDGYRFAEETGHQVTALRPALVPFETGEVWVKELQGLSLRNVQIEIRQGGKILYREFGEMLFTHFGVSGPALLSASSIMGDRLPAGLYIDLKPALTREQLDRRILRDFSQAANKRLKNALEGLYPAKLIPVLLKAGNLDREKPVHEITKEERQRLLEVTKAFTVTLTGLRNFSEAVVTRGGVSVRDVQAGTMESKRVKGLYFAGEVLDVDALTGGYNLQIAWSTGFLAGKAAKKAASAGCTGRDGKTSFDPDTISTERERIL